MVPEIARFIFWSIPNVSYVTFMGLEPIGFAKKNWAKLHIHVSDHAASLRKAVMFLADRGILTCIDGLGISGSE